MKSKKKVIIMNLTLIVITICLTLLYSLSRDFIITIHKLTPEGEQLKNTKQIQKDIAYLFRDKFRMKSVRVSDSKTSIPLIIGKDKDVLKRSFLNETDKNIQISFEDKNLRDTYLNINKEGKVIVTNQAIRFLIYFIHREYDPSIKAVYAIYSTREFNFFEPTKQATIVVVIDEFKDEYDQLVRAGYEGRELERKLVDKFIYYNN